MIIHFSKQQKCNASSTVNAHDVLEVISGQKIFFFNIWTAFLGISLKGVSFSSQKKCCQWL